MSREVFRRKGWEKEGLLIKVEGGVKRKRTWGRNRKGRGQMGNSMSHASFINFNKHVFWVVCI